MDLNSLSFKDGVRVLEKEKQNQLKGGNSEKSSRIQPPNLPVEPF